MFCQAFGGLRPTGQLDSETVALMKRPRLDNWGKLTIEGILQMPQTLKTGVGRLCPCCNSLVRDGSGYQNT